MYLIDRQLHLQLAKVSPGLFEADGFFILEMLIQYHYLYLKFYWDRDREPEFLVLHLDGGAPICF